MICFFGRILLRPTLGISIIGMFTLISVDMFSSLMYGKNRNREIYWTVFFLAIGVGAGVAYLLRKMPKFNSFIVAAYAGENFGVAVANGIYFVWESKSLYWILIIVFTIGVACITLFGINKHMIWVTAVFGAFIFMRSLALLLSHYPVVQNLPDLVETGAVTTILPNYDWYMSLWFCVSGLGVATQLIFLKCMQ